MVSVNLESITSSKLIFSINLVKRGNWEQFGKKFVTFIRIANKSFALFANNKITSG